jgi:hypothetical protein
LVWPITGVKKVSEKWESKQVSKQEAGKRAREQVEDWHYGRTYFVGFDKNPIIKSNVGPFAPMVAQFIKENVFQIEMLFSILQEHFEGKLYSMDAHNRRPV